MACGSFGPEKDAEASDAGDVIARAEVEVMRPSPPAILTLLFVMCARRIEMLKVEDFRRISPESSSADETSVRMRRIQPAEYDRVAGERQLTKT